MKDSVTGQGTPTQKQEKAHYNFTLACILYDAALLCKEDPQTEKAFRAMLRKVCGRVAKNKGKVDLFTWLHDYNRTNTNFRCCDR